MKPSDSKNKKKVYPPIHVIIFGVGTVYILIFLKFKLKYYYIIFLLDVLKLHIPYKLTQQSICQKSQTVMVFYKPLAEENEFEAGT